MSRHVRKLAASEDMSCYDINNIDQHDLPDTSLEASEYQVSANGVVRAVVFVLVGLVAFY
jgi:hypothetical protein